ncbi:MAG TPA: type III pantothenate kinase, partial [Longimicrobiales bacterium]|nr:type III pantothenate kinase [Longimicrobiales bacterium]
GNTETVVGVTADGHELVAHWRLSTTVPRTADEYTHLLRSLLREAEYGPERFRRSVLGSVVPSASEVLSVALPRVADGPVFAVGPDSPLPITLDVEEPRTVGADRIVNTLGAATLYRRDTITVDLGTATTFDVITEGAVFMGGVIAPGVSAGLEWLGRRTAKLPRVELVPPTVCIGRRTEACIQSGIFYGVVDAVDGMVRRIREEWERPDALVVATGGFAGVVGPHCASVDLIEPFLTLRGLAIAGEHLGGKDPRRGERPDRRSGCGEGEGKRKTGGAG